jgi:hypothetical protein
MSAARAEFVGPPSLAKFLLDGQFDANWVAQSFFARRGRGVRLFPHPCHIHSHPIFPLALALATRHFFPSSCSTIKRSRDGEADAFRGGPPRSSRPSSPAAANGVLRQSLRVISNVVRM